MRRFSRVSRQLAAGIGVLLLAAVWYVARLGLTLTHYDAKAHLVVARRVLDSLTPGWEQIGAVWLPLPHLLNLLPVQIDAFYRTGGSALAITVLAGVVTAAAIAETVLTLTGSRAGAVAAVALFFANPNVLYLHATPMTEPLLFALVAVQVLLAVQWVTRGELDALTSLGWATVLACLTRYEAWAVTGAVFGLAGLARWRRGTPVRTLVPALARLAVYPAVTVAGFLLLSRVTVGAWFVSDGFFVVDETLHGQAGVVVERIRDGVAALSSPWLVRAAIASLAVLAVVGLSARSRAALLVPLALYAAAALPFFAYVEGHPFRVRYQIPLLLASAVSAGCAIGLTRRAAPLIAAGVLALVLADVSPLDREAPMVREARLDVANRDGRRAVAACLRERYRGETIMASMGALAHFMQELSEVGLDLRDFLHEGNHPMWDSAFTRGPLPFAGWLLIEERAEGGDALFQRAAVLPRFLDGYVRECEGGNVALYQRR